jgi:hypothetical protein
MEKILNANFLTELSYPGMASARLFLPNFQVHKQMELKRFGPAVLADPRARLSKIETTSVNGPGFYSTRGQKTKM